MSGWAAARDALRRFDDWCSRWPGVLVGALLVAGGAALAGVLVRGEPSWAICAGATAGVLLGAALRRGRPPTPRPPAWPTHVSPAQRPD